MSEWKEYRLGDFMEFNPKICLKKNQVARKITMDQLVPHSRDIYSWTYEPYSGGAKFQNGDTIMARITPCLENGKHAFISLLDENEIAFGSTEFIVIRGRKGISDNSFVYYLSKIPSFKESAIKSMVGSSGRQRAQVDVLENLTMKLPSIPEQTIIASFLSSLDDKIAVNKKICENLEAQAQALFKHWFVDFAPFKDGKFVESELGLIPEGLIYKRIGDMPHTLETGKRPTGGVKGIDSGVPSIGAENIKGLGCYDFSKTKYVTEEFASTMKKGIINGYELLIYKDGGKPGYFIPNFAIFGEGYPYDRMCLNEHVFKLDFGNKGYSLFTYFYFKTKQIMSYLNAQGAKAAIPGINSKDIDAIMMPSLENECVKQYCSEIEDIITQILVLSKESYRLSTLRDTLLPKLMSGEISLD